MVLGIFVLSFIAFMLFLVFEDIVETIRYFSSTVCEGTVIESYGTERVLGGVPARNNTYRTYEKYYVKYEYYGEELGGLLLTNKRNLQPGTIVNVHVNDSTSVHEIISDQFWNRTLERLIVIGLTVAVITFEILFN